MTPKFTGSVQDGELIHNSPVYYENYLKTLEGEKVVITVKKWRPQRTQPQNAYYWGVVIPIIAEHLGYDKEECHEALKWHFLKRNGDGALPTVTSTAKLSTAQFCEYLEQVCRWAASEFGLYIPEPNE